MSNHIKLKGQVVCHCLLKVGFGGYGVVEIIERVQPFVFRLDSGLYAELGLCCSTIEPYIKQVLAFVFGRRGLY